MATMVKEDVAVQTEVSKAEQRELRRKEQKEKRQRKEEIEELARKLGSVIEARDCLIEQLAAFDKDIISLLQTSKPGDNSTEQLELNRHLSWLVGEWEVPQDHREAVKDFERINAEGTWWFRFKPWLALFGYSTTIPFSWWRMPTEFEGFKPFLILFILSGVCHVASWFRDKWDWKRRLRKSWQKLLGIAEADGAKYFPKFGGGVDDLEQYLSRHFGRLCLSAKKELIAALCEKSGSYGKDFKKVAGEVRPLVLVMSGAVAVKITDVHQALISAVVAAFLWSSFKFARNTFCRTYSEKWERAAACK